MDNPIDFALYSSLMQPQPNERKSDTKNPQYESCSISTTTDPHIYKPQSSSPKLTSLHITSTCSPNLSPSGSFNSPSGASPTQPAATLLPQRSWPKRIISDLRDFYYVISPTYRFIYCSPFSQEIVGYKPEELIGRSVLDFIHEDNIDTFIRKLSHSLNRKVFDLYYYFRKKDGKYSMFELQSHPYYQPGDLNPMCFFCISQPHPSKESNILDTFLELKIENEQLRKRLYEFEESVKDKVLMQSDHEIQPDRRQYNSSPNSMILSTSESLLLFNANCPLDLQERFVGAPLTTLDLNDKDDSSEQEGLFESRKKKKLRIEDNQGRICSDCNTIDSPEWRRGPQGPKTLCNACVLRWTKRTKQERQS